MQKGQVICLRVSEYNSVFLDIEITGLMDWKYYRHIGIVHI